MGGGDMNIRRSSYFSGSCMSPSCVPVHEEYTRINIINNGHGGGSNGNRSRRLKKIIKKLMSERKNIYGSRPTTLTFQYDAVSYSQNFDEGFHNDEYPRFHHDFKWHIPK